MGIQLIGPARYRRPSGLIFWTVAVCLLMCSAGCGKGEVRDVLSAKRIVVVDKDGKERLLLETEMKDGAPSLSLNDRNGAPRLMLSLSGGETPKVALLDDRERSRAEIALTEDGVPTVGLYGEDGRMRAWLVAREPGGLLILSDASGPRVQVGQGLLKPEVVKRTQPWSLVVLDGDGKLLAAVP